MLNHSWKKGYWPIHVFTISNYQVSIQFINVIFKLDFMLFSNFDTKLRQLISLLVLWTGLWSFFSASWHVNGASTELCRCNFWHQGVAIIKRLSGMYNDSVKLWLEAKEKLDEGAELMCADGRAKKTNWGQFWSAEQFQRMSVCHRPVTGTQNTEHNWCRLFRSWF